MPVPGKLVESIIKDKIIKHIGELAFLKKNQHGFFKSKSCLINLLQDFEESTGMRIEIVQLKYTWTIKKILAKSLIRDY